MKFLRGFFANLILLTLTIFGHETCDAGKLPLTVQMEVDRFSCVINHSEAEHFPAATMAIIHDENNGFGLGYKPYNLLHFTGKTSYLMKPFDGDCPAKVHF